MPQSPTVNYMLYDHLGSTNITTDTNGAVVTGLRYRAWGEVRYPTNGTNPGPSKYTYTGQYSNVDDFGLMFYNARWYDPQLGRFAQADSIIPAGVQGLDRYAYARNSPLNYIDPSGHEECEYDDDCEIEADSSYPNTLTLAEIMKLLGFENEKDFNDWISASDQNAQFAEMLTYAKVGDVIQLNWNSTDQHLRIVEYGDSVGFYHLEAKSLLKDDVMHDFTSNSEQQLLGAGILRDQDGDGVFSPRLKWVGFYRPGANGSPSDPSNWHMRPGEQAVGSAPAMKGVAQGAELVLTGIATIGCAFAGGGVPGGIACGGLTYGASEAIIDALDVDSVDYHVQAGPVYFNFQVQPVPGSEWVLEKIR